MERIFSDRLSSAGPAAQPMQVDAQQPLLRWMIFTGLTLFAATLMWRYGWFGLMLWSDRTYISSVIVFLYVCACLHCLWRTVAISREGEFSRAGEVLLDADQDDHTLSNSVGNLPPGCVTEHIRNLIEKSRRQGGGKIDQTLLLRTLADRLRGSNGLGAFISDTLMKLGLLGTIIGFIIMLAPIAGLDASNKEMMKTSMGVMSDGMAVAMYTTLAGLVGSILLKVQYYMLDAATNRIFARAVTLTETRVVPALERRHAG
jgi:MotA/TolQ/ExbB proton channel family